MARAKNLFEITGSMAKFSMYRLQGHDEVIVRTKGGPSKYQIKNKPQFEKVRRNNEEWKACTGMTSQIREGYYFLKRLEDYPTSGALNAIAKQMQKLDTESEHGKRNILLSKHKEILPGFSLSRKQVFESVLKVPVTTSIDRAAGEATIEIPDINTNFYLYNFRKLPYYRILANFSSLVDIVHDGENYINYLHTGESYTHRDIGIFESEWFPSNGSQPGMTIRLSHPIETEHLSPHITLMLTIGIEFGQNGNDNTITPVKYSGTGKIIRVA